MDLYLEKMFIRKKDLKGTIRKATFIERSLHASRCDKYFHVHFLLQIYLGKREVMRNALD